jgi:class 3 adenylate cyclase
MDAPRTRYTSRDGVHIAYQVFGDGPIDLLYIPTAFSQMEHFWEEPLIARFFERLAEFSRVILFDRRGSGMSDPFEGPPILEDQVDDVISVMDAAGSERASVVAQFEGSSMAMMFAAAFPDRVDALALHSPIARMTRNEEVHWANTVEDREAMIDATIANWGSGGGIDLWAPSVADNQRLREWFGKLERLAASPGALRKLMDMGNQLDVTSILSTIRVPTLVTHPAGDAFIDRRHAELVVSRIPDAKFVELPAGDLLPLLAGADNFLDVVEEFLTGGRREREPDRVLATVLFTDIVGSTKHATAMGDSRWRDLLQRHDALTQREIERRRGRFIKSTGDGVLATFDGPARAVQAACDISVEIQRLGIDIRAGLHTGEIELRGDDVAGMAVHIGARVGALGGPGEVIVSSTVKDLVVGSGIEFADRGAHELKGVPGEWRLYSVES